MATEPDLRFWRDSAGNEVDLLKYGGDGVEAYEIKSGATFSPDFFKGLIKWQSQASSVSSSLNVIYNGASDLQTSHGQLLAWNNL